MTDLSEVDVELKASQTEGSDNRPNVYYDESIGKTVYRASSLGNCLTGLILDKRGFEQSEPPDFMKKAWAAGNKFEDEIIRRFCSEEGFKRLDSPEQYEQYGTYNLERKQIETELPVGGKAVVRCHPDEIVQCYRTDESARRAGREVGDRYVLEVKAFAKSTYEAYKSKGIMGFPYYSWQLAIEMLTTGLPAAYVVGLKETDDDKPEDWPDTAAPWTPGIKFLDVKWYTLDDIPHSKLDVIKRVMFVERGAEAAEAGDGMPDGGRCEWAQYPCGHFANHVKEGVWAEKRGEGEDEKFRGEIEVVSPEVATVEKNEVQLAVYELNMANEMIKKYKKQADSAKAALKIELVVNQDGKKGEYWKVGRYHAVVESRVGAWEMDEAALVRAGKRKEDYEKMEMELRKFQKRGPGSTWVSVKEAKA